MISAKLYTVVSFSRNEGGTSRHAGDGDKVEENCTIKVQNAMTI